MKIEQRDEKKAIEYLEKAAHDSRVSTRNDECKSEAQLLVGICYYRGFIVEQDFTRHSITLKKPPSIIMTLVIILQTAIGKEKEQK